MVTHTKDDNNKERSKQDETLKNTNLTTADFDKTVFTIKYQRKNIILNKYPSVTGFHDYFPISKGKK